MPDSTLKIDVARWVEQVRDDSTAHQWRQAIELILNAIAAKSPLNKKMFLKGGILMGLAYDSPRQTVDIDLTTSLKAENDTGEWIREQLDEELPRVAARLGYDELVAAVQSAKWQRGGFPETAEFPALRLKVGYARRGTNQEEALRRGRAANVIGIISSMVSGPETFIEIERFTQKHGIRFPELEEARRRARSPNKK